MEGGGGYMSSQVQQFLFLSNWKSSAVLKEGGDIISIFFQKDHSGSSMEEGLRLEVMGVTKVIQQDTEIAYEKPMRTVESGDRQEGPDFRDIPEVGATGLDD